jgi:type VI secretion system protein ImpC
LGDEAAARPVDSGEPFRILVLGDFGGRLERRPLEVDRDNLDARMQRLGTGIESPVPLQFRELEDFHPDRIFTNAGVFGRLREEAFAPGQAAPAPLRPPAPVASPTAAGLLDRVLDSTLEEGAEEGVLDPMQAFLRRATSSASVTPEEKHAAETAESLREPWARAMGAILHSAGFQRLEAAWKSLDLLVRGLETGTGLKVYLLDVPKGELPAALATLQPEDGWTLLTALASFGLGDKDAGILRACGRHAARLRAPFLAEGDVASAEGGAAWDQLRGAPEARWLGLCMPRFLLRVPYGKDTSPIDSFAFEEMPDPPRHPLYLWGHPAVCLALLLGGSFQEEGWAMRPGSRRTLEGLPTHTYSRRGDVETQPCAELLLTEDQCETLLDAGIMPLAADRHEGRITVVRFQSITLPSAPLASRWGD